MDGDDNNNINSSNKLLFSVWLPWSHLVLILLFFDFALSTDISLCWMWYGRTIINNESGGIWEEWALQFLRCYLSIWLERLIIPIVSSTK
jgi:hypothetical protein